LGFVFLMLSLLRHDSMFSSSLQQKVQERNALPRPPTPSAALANLGPVYLSSLAEAPPATAATAATAAATAVEATKARHAYQSRKAHQSNTQNAVHQQPQQHQTQPSTQGATPPCHVADSRMSPELATNSSPAYTFGMTPGFIHDMYTAADEVEREVKAQPSLSYESFDGASDDFVTAAPPLTSASRVSVDAPLPCGQADQPSREAVVPSTQASLSAPMASSSHVEPYLDYTCTCGFDEFDWETAQKAKKLLCGTSRGVKRKLSHDRKCPAASMMTVGVP
jgi:hypothetical protein